MYWHWVFQPCSCLRKREKKALGFILRKRLLFPVFSSGKRLQLWTAITSSALSDFEVLKLIKTEAKWIKKRIIEDFLLLATKMYSKRDIRSRGVVDILPQPKTKLLYSRWKRGFDESIDKFRLSVVSLSDWLAYLTHFLYRLEFKTMPRSQSFQRALHYACASFKFWLVYWIIWFSLSVYQFCWLLYILVLTSVLTLPKAFRYPSLQYKYIQFSFITTDPKMLKMRRFLAFLGAAELIHVIAKGIEKRWTSLERAKFFNKLKREWYQVKNKKYE